jgi:hypothetical protein
MDPGVVSIHFDQIADIFKDKRIWLTEVGYQSGSEYCNGSEIKQALFYHQLFNSWDDHSDQIELLIVDWLHDQSDESIEHFLQYYQLSDPAFAEFLSTLGLRHHDHRDKPAWLQVLEEVSVRGW